MSFRLFVYYCAVWGGCAAFVGWALGRLASQENHAVADAGVQGLCLGLLVAFGLSLVDALWTFTRAQVVSVGLRVVAAMLVGSLGGLAGGALGQLLYGATQNEAFRVLGWTITGLLVGASVGTFDFLSRSVRGEETRGARRKIRNGVVGGTAGGLTGGVLSVILNGLWARVFHGGGSDAWWSPSACGFVVLGMCIGLLIGLAQVVLKEAWVRVEAGFRPGRELILSGAVTTIGRAEACDIGLFGDSSVEPFHARIVREGNRFMLTDSGTHGGTFLNGEPVDGPTPLCSGDTIQVGNSILRFAETHKRAE